MTEHEAVEGGRLAYTLLQATPDEADLIAAGATRNELHLAAVTLTIALQTIAAMFGADIGECAQIVAARDRRE